MYYHEHHVQVIDLLYPYMMDLRSSSKIVKMVMCNVYDSKQAREKNKGRSHHHHHQMRRKEKKGEKVN